MSLSLSSLLNPSPGVETKPPQSPNSRRESNPPPPYTLSPQHQNVSPPHVGGAYEQASTWHPSRRGSGAFEARPGSSGYDGQMQLPPPTTDARKMSSPTLEQYRVASKSPEQRRASLISPPHSAFTLPPFKAGEHDAARDLSQAHVPSVSTDLQAASSLPPARLTAGASTMSTFSEQADPELAPIKQENVHTPLTSSPAATPQRHAAPIWDGDAQSIKSLATLKQESSVRNNSPLRESSVPIPSTETVMLTSTVPKKRSAPATKSKKGMATTITKKVRPTKKRKVEVRRSVTPSSQASKTPAYKGISGKGTPMNSSPARSTRSQSADSDDGRSDDEGEEEDEDMDDGDGNDGDVYCICRKADNGTFMIGCDGTCDDWFHGKCVGIEERDKNLIDKYICPECTKAGKGRTTWKRICRRSGCRQPARRGGKSKTGKDASKYCSEECGILYFRDKVARTRGREEPSRHRSAAGARRNSIQHRPSLTNADSDLGPRGGLLAAGELKVLVNASKTADDFKKLGDGVLSPPPTPSSSQPPAPPTSLSLSETQTLRDISARKDAARQRHQLLKDRMKFVTLVKAAATRAAAEKELKPKEYCGYDSRLEWADAQFATWRTSPAGELAFSRDTLAVEKEDDGDVTMDGVGHTEDAAGYEVCERKKCARHLEWSKLVVDEVRFEMSDNSDRMRALDREEREVRERAALRAKAGESKNEGTVERHGNLQPKASGEVMGLVEPPVAAGPNEDVVV